MSAEGTGSDKARGAPRRNGASAPELSPLEQALRQALGAVPREQVVKCIVSVLPATVFVEDSGRLHSGKVRKVSVSMPEELALPRNWPRQSEPAPAQAASATT